ncbi:hypothetical protein DA075_11480 [Methylobacterium currus]|uniref:Periplasmic copper-binding protein NosD beta helix domain-containing protein n=1 Tax=Methylobacterium currus TaxID=2051553 RepID=A0A2R4WIV2_9HYPH|nr:NosD domain-containing protein [Methylobacterium currus]AWB21459.1 hypothetical protein DA075_11480 [Methylobacterium currus]
MTALTGAVMWAASAAWAREPAGAGEVEGARRGAPGETDRAGCTAVDRLGAVPDGVTDTLPILDAAVAAQTARGGEAASLCLQFGTGTYFFSQPWSYVYPEHRRHGLTIRGAGSSATLLKFASSSGLSLTLNGAKQAVHLQGLTMTTTQAGGGSGIKVVQTQCLGSFVQSTFDDVAFEGDSGKAYWGTGAEIVGLSGTSWRAVTVYGDDTWRHGRGLSFRGNPSACTVKAGYSIYHNIAHGIFNQLDVGLLYDDYVQGVTVTQSNFQNGNYGILQPPGMKADANVQLMVSNSQFQVALAGIRLDSGIKLTQVTGSLFLIGPDKDALGIQMKNSDLSTITGNIFNTIGAGGVGIRYQASASAFFGNAFSGLQTGIDVLPGSVNNTFGANNFNVVRQPTAGTPPGKN